jgi:hypothetical protein
MNWEQLKTILWLRWRLTRNQWARSGGLGAVIALIVGLGALLLGLVSFIAAFFGGLFGLGEVKPLAVMGVWLGLTAAFLFFWMIGLINELQRSETIDLQRLMHLPVALGQMFVVNYLASHLALSIIIVLPAMMGLSLGLVFSRGPIMLLLAPLALSLVFMVTAWTYCLRGWLAAMMSNPRRRRAIIVGVTFAFILLAQTPNLYFNGVWRLTPPPKQTAATPAEAQRQREERTIAAQAKLNTLLAAQKFVPFLWLPVGARRLAEGHTLPAVLGTLGGFGIGALGLRRAYRGTVRFYQGDHGATATAKVESVEATAQATAQDKKNARFLELRLPAVPEQAAAFALAAFRSLLRAPEVKMAWASSFFVTLIVGASVVFRSTVTMSAAAKPFLAAAAVAFPIFMLVQFFANQFGFDRDGFRALILSPADRRLILLGKNLACFPVGVLFGVLVLALVSIWLRLSPLALAAALFQLATLLLIAGLAGNLISILAPYRIRAGSMKPTKMPGLAMLVMVVCHLLFPLAMAPVFVPPLLELLWQTAGWSKVVPVNFIFSVLLATLTAILYWRTLGPLGRLLQRREIKILNTVTAEQE